MTAASAKENFRCFKCERPYTEHDNTIKEWGECREKVRQLKARMRFGMCEGWCKREYPFSELTIHHVHPRRLGGNNRRSNLLPLCEACHSYVEQVLREQDDTYLWAIAFHRLGAEKNSKFVSYIKKKEIAHWRLTAMLET